MMKSKNPKLNMLAVLGATRALVVQSELEGWTAESAECGVVLDQMMSHIINPKKNVCPKYANIQFAPRGPIQEIAISNGWHDSYMELSTEYDELEKELNIFITGDA
jgi:hypothetical protein